jgi:hypothetical protein
MPGLFLVSGDTILWKHDFRHAGDHPDFLKIADHLPTRAKAHDGR